MVGPDSLKLPQLAKDAIAKFGLPLFQRELKWSWEHQSELLVSIMNKIPIGTILIWNYDQATSKEKINMRPIANIEKEDNDIQALVLDGQQRVTFLSWLWKSVTEEKYADILAKHSKKKGGYIYLHLDDDAKKPKRKTDESEKDYLSKIQSNSYGRFSIGKRRKKDSKDKNEKDGLYDLDENLILVQHLLDEKTQIEHLLAKFKDHQNKEWISDLYYGLQNTSVNTFTLGSNVSYGDALLIYERVNVAGTKLQGRDVTEAVFISKWKELYNQLKDTEEELSDNGKFKSVFQRKRIMNCLTDDMYSSIAAKPKNMSVFNPKNSSGDELTEKMVKSSYQKVKKSLIKVKKILKESFYLENDKTIGTDYPIVIASAYIRTHFPKEDMDMGEHRGKLAKWMALAILRKHYTGGSTNTKVEDDLEAVKSSKSPWDKLYENMSRYVKLSSAATAKFQPEDLGNLDSSRYPSLKKEWAGTLLKSAMFHNNTRDPHTRELLVNEERLEWHHIYPQALVNKNSKNYGGDDFFKKHGKNIHHPANMSLISKGTNLRIKDAHPEKYLPPLAKSDTAIAKNHQWQHFTKMKKGAMAFWVKRQEDIADYINKFLLKLSGNIKPTEPPTSVDHKNRIQYLEEGQLIEFKATFRVHTEGEGVIGKVDKKLEQIVAKEICGMLNSGGGWLYIGVSEVKNEKGQIKTEVTGIESDIRSLDNPKKGKTGNFELFEAHFRRTVGKYIILPTDVKFKKQQLYITEEVKFDNGVSAMGVRIFPWSECNAAFRESSKSEVAVEFSRHGASKNIEQTGSWSFNGEIWTKI